MLNSIQELSAMQGAALQGLGGLGQFSNLYAAEREKMMRHAQYDAYRRGATAAPTTIGRMRSEVKEWLKDWKD